MSDVLSQEEIDELLKALSSGEININEIQRKEEEKKVIVYDFRRPHKFSKEQLRTLENIYEHFSRLMSSNLSGILRSFCQVNVSSVEPQTYYEFYNSLPDPVILCVIDFNPLRGSILFEISPGIAYAIIDRLLGGPGTTIERVRDFTEIELTLLERVAKQLLPLMNESWANVLKADFRLVRIETNAQFAQIVSPNEAVAIITLNVNIGNVHGLVNLCIPHMVIEPILNKLTTKYWYSSEETGEKREKKSELLKRRIETTKLELRAVLGEATITVKEFLELQPGDVIRLNKKINENISILIGNREKFRGVVGLRNKNLAVQITEIERVNY